MINEYLKIICMGLCIAIVNLMFSNFVIGEEEKPGNLGILFTPVREEVVDELPEGVKEFPMLSMMPVVFRGAGQNWGAMKWTAESLAEMGFKSPSKVFGTDYRSVEIVQVYGGKDRMVDNQELADLIERDTNFREDYSYSREFYPSGMKNPKFKYILFAGGPGASQIFFDYHEAVLLAEFYGEKLIFLMAPGNMSEDSKYSRWITNDLKKYMKEGLTMKEAMMKVLADEKWDKLMKPGEEYSPRQRVILKPGDVLYIPAGWAHRVFYLNDSLGVTQVIEQDTVNWGK